MAVVGVVPDEGGRRTLKEDEAFFSPMDGILFVRAGPFEAFEAFEGRPAWPSTQSGGSMLVSAVSSSGTGRFNLDVENAYEQADEGRNAENLSHEIKFSGPNGDREGGGDSLLSRPQAG